MPLQICVSVAARGDQSNNAPSPGPCLQLQAPLDAQGKGEGDFAPECAEKVRVRSELPCAGVLVGKTGDEESLLGC